MHWTVRTSAYSPILAGDYAFAVSHISTSRQFQWAAVVKTQRQHKQHSTRPTKKY